MTLSPRLIEQTRAALREAAVDKVKFAKLFFGYDLAPKQVEAVNMGGRVSVKCAGRRFGKSTTTNIEVVHKCITQPNAVAYIIGPSIDQAQIYFDELEVAIKNSVLLESYIDGEILHRPFPMVKFKNGSVIHGRSTAYDGRYIRGKGADIVAVTEAAFVKSEVFQKPIRALTLDRQGRIIVESTPNGHDYFYDLFVKGNEDGDYYKSFYATVYDNPRLSVEDIEMIKSEIPDMAFRIEYMAEFIDDDAFVFPWIVLEPVFIDYEALLTEEGFRTGERIPGHRYVIGVDLAKLRDYTVITVLDCGIPGTKEKFKIVEWAQLQKVDYTTVIIPAINRMQEKYQAQVYLDSTGVGEVIQEQINNVVPYVFTQKSREDLVNRLILTVEQQGILLPMDNKILFTEMRFFQRQRHGLSVRAEAAAGHHDDAVFSLALAVWGATTQNPGIFLYYKQELERMGIKIPSEAAQEPVSDVLVES